jgi:hypothetical protein
LFYFLSNLFKKTIDKTILNTIKGLNASLIFFIK